MRIQKFKGNESQVVRDLEIVRTDDRMEADICCPLTRRGQVQIHSDGLPEIQSRMVYGLICMTVGMCPSVSCPRMAWALRWFNTMIGAILNIRTYITQWSDQMMSTQRPSCFTDTLQPKLEMWQDRW